MDKTGLIHVLNPLLHTTHNLVLVSRARRFGKSYAAAMLCAYYGHGCDARQLFENRQIARMDSSLSHLGEYDILYIDLSQFKGEALEKQKQMDSLAQKQGKEKQCLDWVDFLKREIMADIRKAYGRKGISYSFFKTLENTVEKTGRKFFWICDEWDLFFREDIPDVKAAENYLEMMRALFKTINGYTERVFAGEYLTGILPMKKMKGESVVSSFDNYTMLDPGVLAPYTGFTASEVKTLCHLHKVSYEKMEEWYDGYRFAQTEAVFNPRSVMEASD